MSYVEVLVEGDADVPVMREILTRKFTLEDGVHFRIHPHQGKGKLPEDPFARPELRHRGLLDQLPAKLRGFAKSLPAEACVLVLVDADDTPCTALLADLKGMLVQLGDKRPPNVLFRLAIEETESWFIADPAAIKLAYPKANIKNLPKTPDEIVGAWELLAKAIGTKVAVSGRDKHAWAEKISPHLNLDQVASPSLRKLIAGISQHLHP